MSHIIGKIQGEALETFLSKEIKKHLKKFAKTTEMERTNFDDFLQDWEWSLDPNGTICKLYQAYNQLNGRTILLKIEF
jgi:hypothetical protein